MTRQPDQERADDEVEGARGGVGSWDPIKTPAASSLNLCCKRPPESESVRASVTARLPSGCNARLCC
eukprot:2254484-Rhodomonas_salina.3